MNQTTRISKAERVGRWLARGRRGYLRSEREVSGWLVAQGLPAPIVSTLLWIVTLAVVVGLLYTAFWLALLLGFAVAAAWVAGHSNEQDEDDFLGRNAEERDHRKSIFYHPASFNDDPDPRFEDD
ncbi:MULTISPECIES: DUF3742 family protein [Alcaligenaceae]|uniref:DUF3742 family protein n=1 Tax=Alcaligenaceae TaxID=506 RepID=UPI0022B53EF5|nr:DUF3742 family protein [Castellaniella sp. S9]